ncbi:MAG: GTP 3',8-cyclase MoaA [Lentimicrobiaceae bacterium]
MFDSYNRRINYLRISVTDRCNLRCTYCMPAEGITLMPHSDILSFEEIMEVVDAALAQGVDKIRITGGEPLVRKDIITLIQMISSRPGIQDLGMTTNGQLLEKYAQSLKDAGLHRVNVSLDTLNPETYRQVTRGGDIDKVLKGIEASVNAGLAPVKINCVIVKSSSEPDAVEVAEFGKKLGLQVRFIRQMDLEKGEFYIVDGGSGGDCSTCNRLRLTANGMIKPCLFNDMEYNIREHGAHKALQLALGNKPSCGTINKHGEFYNIGG